MAKGEDIGTTGEWSRCYCHIVQNIGTTGALCRM